MPVSVHNPRHSTSSLYDESLLSPNTPWSSSPRSSATSLTRPRRSSSPPRPLVVQKSHAHAHSHTPAMTKTLLIPNSSRGHTQYHNRTARYYDAMTLAEQQEAGHEFPRAGRTKFPKNLVSPTAVESHDLPYMVESDGAVTVLKALGQPDIDSLVAHTQKLSVSGSPPTTTTIASSHHGRHHRHHSRDHDSHHHSRSRDDHDTHYHRESRRESHRREKHYESRSRHRSPSRSPSINGKAVSFSERTVVHEVPTQPVKLVQGHAHNSSSSYLSSSPPTFEPLSPPGPSTPRPTKTLEFGLVPGVKTPAEKIHKAERKAAKAEGRFLETGREEDRIDAIRAREKVEEVKRKMENRRRVGVTVGRNQKGEVVIVKG